MQIKDVLSALNSWAPFSYQENYDNARLLVGDPKEEVRGCLVSLDCIESVVDEAISLNVNVVVSHHPILFGSLKSLTGKNYVERTLLKAIKNDINLIAVHTNLDNVYHGVNHKIGNKLGLSNLEILNPKKGVLRKLVTFCPTANIEEVKAAIFKAGAGKIGKYGECSFSVQGIGTFKASTESNPYVGEIGTQHQENELRIETIYPKALEPNILQALLHAHPYEEVAYDIYPLENKTAQIGAGMIGELPEESDEVDFMNRLKKRFHLKQIRHTKLLDKGVKKVAFCGGAGSFLLPQAIANNADVFITGDFKYHEFFDADQNIVIMDIGHYESEQYTIELIADFLKDKFTTFATHLTEVDTNPVNYF